MYQSRLLSPRPLRALCVFLAVSVTGLWLPLRGAAQEGMTRPTSVPSDSGDGSSGDTATSSGRRANDSAVSDSGTGTGNTAATVGDAGTSGMNSDNGGDDASGPAGSAGFNPAVGVDTAGHTDVVATRNGRTTRRRPKQPVNPLLITNPLRGDGQGTASSTDGNQATPLIPMREPGDYTLQTDPFQPRRRNAKPLPLFGYDFFQPARQIITARRRALLPPRVVRRPLRTNTTGRTNRTGTGLNDGYNVNGSPNPSVPGIRRRIPGYGIADAAAAAALQRRGANVPPTGFDPNTGLDPNNSFDPNNNLDPNNSFDPNSAPSNGGDEAAYPDHVRTKQYRPNRPRNPVAQQWRDQFGTKHCPRRLG